tara:strand:- start:851 stop:1897 length:1047 start_codon:yes stop_codon:yes gene_type:complete
MKILFAGLGSIGQRHLRNLLSLEDTSFEVSAFRSTKSAPLLSESREPEHGVNVAKHYGVVVFDDIEAALEEKPDITFVTNPNSLHVDVALAAASVGSDLFIEKPLSNNFDGIDELKNVVERQKLIVALGYQYRFHPGILRAKNWLEEGRIGNPVAADFVNGEYIPAWHPWEDYRLSYGARADLGGGAVVSQIHEFDLIYWMFGLPESVFAVGGHLSSLEIDVEDSVSALFRLPWRNGAIPVSLHLDYLQKPPVRCFTIVGEKGRIVWHEQRKLTTLELIEGDVVEEFLFSDFERNDMFAGELLDFLQSVRLRRSPSVDLEAGICSLQMSLAARDSMQSGDRVLISNSV